MHQQKSYLGWQQIQCILNMYIFTDFDGTIFSMIFFTKIGNSAHSELEERAGWLAKYRAQ